MGSVGLPLQGYVRAGCPTHVYLILNPEHLGNQPKMKGPDSTVLVERVHWWGLRRSVHHGTVQSSQATRWVCRSETHPQDREEDKVTSQLSGRLVSRAAGLTTEQKVADVGQTKTLSYLCPHPVILACCVPLLSLCHLQ